MCVQCSQVHTCAHIHTFTDTRTHTDPRMCVHPLHSPLTHRGLDPAEARRPLTQESRQVAFYKVRLDARSP